MKLLLSAITLMMLSSCHGTSLTIGAQRSFSELFTGAGSNSNQVRPTGETIDSFGVSITTWIDKPQVKIELPERVVDLLRPRVDPVFRRALPDRAETEEEHDSHSGYVGALNSLGSWGAGKIAALSLPIFAIAFVAVAVYRHRKK